MFARQSFQPDRELDVRARHDVLNPEIGERDFLWSNSGSAALDFISCKPESPASG